MKKNFTFSMVLIVALTVTTSWLTPKWIDGDFFDGTSTASVTKNGIHIGVTMQPDPSWEKIGLMTKLGK